MYRTQAPCTEETYGWVRMACFYVLSAPITLPVLLGHVVLGSLLPQKLAEEYQVPLANSLIMALRGELELLPLAFLALMLYSFIMSIRVYQTEQSYRIRVSPPRVLANFAYAFTCPLASVLVPAFGAAVGLVGTLRLYEVLDDMDIVELKPLLLSPVAAAAAGWCGYALIFIVVKFWHEVRMAYKRRSKRVNITYDGRFWRISRNGTVVVIQG